MRTERRRGRPPGSRRGNGAAPGVEMIGFGEPKAAQASFVSRQAIDDALARPDGGISPELAAEIAAAEAVAVSQEQSLSFERRIVALEMAYGQMIQIHREQLERQSRYSALDLAIKATPEGVTEAGVMTALAEAFLAWLRATGATG